MKLYKINPEYLEKLSIVEHKVALDKGGRPYVGVVFTVNGLDYFAPLSSKDFRGKSNNNTFFVLDQKTNLGVVHINNMIPIRDKSLLIPIQISFISDKKYRALIENQLRIIATQKFQDELIKKATALYNAVTKTKDLTHQDKFYKALSNDFLKLEKESIRLSQKHPAPCLML